MKRVKYLAGFVGLAPVAVGLAATGSTQAASAAVTKDSTAKTVSLRHMAAAPNVPSVPTCRGSGLTHKDHNVIIEMCEKENTPYVYWVNESVYYPTGRGITWRLHQRILGTGGSNKVIMTYFLNSGPGWHKHKYFLDKSYKSFTSFCVGATSTPGYPCCNTTSRHCS